MEQKSFNYLILIALIGTMAITWGIQSSIITEIDTIEGGENFYTIDVSGSTTCFPVVSEAVFDFMGLHPNYGIRVSAGGSSRGISDIDRASPLVDIGMSSRNLKSTENVTGELVDHIFAQDGVAVIVNKLTVGLEVINITMNDLFLIYNNTYKTWDQVDADLPAQTINVFVREEASGTRETFEKKVKYNDKIELEDDPWFSANAGTYSVGDGNPAVADAITTTDWSIGYIGLAFIDDTSHEVLEISLTGDLTDAIEPTIDNVKNFEYPIARNLHLFTKGNPEPHVRAFLDYVFGEEGQKIVEQVGYIRLYYPVLDE
jgi:phosphate transport system substrate-binding protein